MRSTGIGSKSSTRSPACHSRLRQTYPLRATGETTLPLRRTEASRHQSGTRRAKVHVVVTQIRPALLRLNDDKVGIQVPIRLLCLGDQIDYAIHAALQCGIGKCAEAVCGGLNPLADVRIPEDVRRIRLTGFPIEFECIDASRLLAPLVLDGKYDAPIDLHDPPPESVLDPNAVARHQGGTFWCLSALSSSHDRVSSPRTEQRGS